MEMGESVKVVDDREVSEERAKAAVGCGTIIATALWPIVGDFYALFHLIFGRFPDFPFYRIAFSCWLLLGFPATLDVLRIRFGDKFRWSAIGLGLVVQFSLLFPHIVTGAVLDAVMERDDHGGSVFLTSLGMAVFCGVWTYYVTRYVYTKWCVPPQTVNP
jgi:hypothetical protein